MPSATQPPNVFISYAHRDADWLDHLLVHLKPYVRDEHLKVWSDRGMRPGDDWRDSIEQALDSAAAAILLVSPHFLASDFISSDELPPLLDARRTRGLRVFWLLISDCAYRITPIANYQAAHNLATPLVALSQAELDSTLAQVCEHIASDPH